MTTIDRDELRFDAEAHLQYGGGGDELANGVLALLDALTRAEAQSETRRQQTVYWQERAEGFEARIKAVDAVVERWETARDAHRPLRVTARSIRRALDGDT